MSSLYAVQAVSRCFMHSRDERLSYVKKISFIGILLSGVLAISLLVTGLSSCCGLYPTGNTTDAVTQDTPTTLFDVSRVEEVLKRLDSSWINALDENLTDFIIESILLSSGDVYAKYMDSEAYSEYTESYYGNFVGIGISVQWNAERSEISVYNVIPDSPASEVGFQPYDILIAVNGTPLVFSSDDTGVLDRVGNLIRGEAGTYVDVTVKRGDEEITFHTERRQVTNPTVRSELLTYNGCSAMYIMLTGFDYTTPIAFKEAIDRAEQENADMLLIDIRNNPGGLLSVVSTMLTYLVPDDTLLCTTEYRTSSSEVRAGQYVDQSDISKTPSLKVTSNGTIVYNQAYADHTVTMPCALLVNQNSASASELFTSVLRDYELATIVGERTYGKGCMQVTYSLKDGYALKLTVAYYTPPCGVNYDKMTDGPVGITPDIEVIFSDEENRYNLYAIEHTADRQFVAAFNALTDGEKLVMPDTTQ